MKARVYVTLKPSVLDPQGRAVQQTLGRLGFDDVADVRVGKYIEMSLAEPSDEPAATGMDRASDAVAERERARTRGIAMCEKLIANPVIEDFRVEIVE